MKNYTFTLYIDIAPEDLTNDLASRIYLSGCDDALVGSQHGKVFVDFDRRATSLEYAINSAIRDLEKAGVKVLNHEEDK